MSNFVCLPGVIWRSKQVFAFDDVSPAKPFVIAADVVGALVGTKKYAAVSGQTIDMAMEMGGHYYTVTGDGKCYPYFDFDATTQTLQQTASRVYHAIRKFRSDLADASIRVFSFRCCRAEPAQFGDDCPRSFHVHAEVYHGARSFQCTGQTLILFSFDDLRAIAVSIGADSSVYHPRRCFRLPGSSKLTRPGDVKRRVEVKGVTVTRMPFEIAACWVPGTGSGYTFDPNLRRLGMKQRILAPSSLVKSLESCPIAGRKHSRTVAVVKTVNGIPIVMCSSPGCLAKQGKSAGQCATCVYDA